MVVRGWCPSRKYFKRVMIVNKQLAESVGHTNKDLWETPDYIFEPLMKEFDFSLDPCCQYHTAKAKKFYTPFENGLQHSWENEVVFVNPPYSRGNIDQWMKKCYEESRNERAYVIALIPVSTSSKWFHEWVLDKADIRYYKGRIRFKGAPFTAPFSSMLAIWK